MKKSICITVDVEALLEAKNKIPNISNYLNECLLSVANRSELLDDVTNLQEQLNEIKNSMLELQVKKSIIENEMRIKEENKKEALRIAKEQEKNNRWLCPVCKNKNLMDNDRCAGCQLPTRKDSKTIIVQVENEL
jgi:hypothetical protein